MKGLVVDDSTVMRKVMAGALSRIGVDDVTQAEDGQEAVDATEIDDFDIVLMDWNMPVMSGIEAVIEIRARGKSTPIIMVTTEAEKSRVVQALKAGANSYIIKPFDIDTILAQIKKFITVSAT